MNEAARFEFQVVIVGAGPTGILAANFLGQYGVSTLIIDREPDIVTIPRAVGICEEGSRILDAAGLMHAHDAQCLPINSIRFVDENLRTQFFADVDWRKDGYRSVRMFHQPSLEKDMRAGLKRYDNVSFWPSTELLDFEHDCIGVQLELSKDGDRQSVSSRFLLACDGAKSFVRKALGIGFSGKTYAQDWVILDVKNNPQANNHVAFSINPKRPSVTMPGPGDRRRWEFVVKKDDDVDTIFDESNLKQLIAPWGDISQVEIERKALYTFHARTAEQYQQDCVFLLGDAAHVTPPFAGQGMMAGFRDAYNLCWKLAAVLEERVSPEFLVSYQRERIPQSKQIINFAQFVGNIVLPQETLRAKLRDGVFGLLGLLGVHSKTKGLALRKLSNHINGSLVRHMLVSGIFKTGTELPQYELDSPNGLRKRTDQFLGPTFHILGWNLDPHDSLDSATLSRWQALNGQITTLSSFESVETKADLLLDRQQNYRDTFAAGRVVLVTRPDQMIVIRCKPSDLNEKLSAYLNSTVCGGCVGECKCT